MTPSRREFLGRTGALVVLGSLPVLGVATASCEIGELTGGSTPAAIDFDVALPAFSRLGEVGGVLPLDAGQKRVLLIRASTNEIVALDRICTHQNCDLDPDAAGRFDAAQGVLVCRCHNARFSTTGAVLQGPATAPLRRYDVRFDAQTGKGSVRLS